jgi:FixJ family two-component response regulator
LDVSLPALSGLDLQQLLTDRREMPIIFITGHGDIPMTVQAMKAGATEFLTKPIDNDALLNAIRGAIERSRAVLGNEAELDVLRTRWNTLTPRERDVIELVVSGLLNKQVGLKLGISEITVKAHRGRAMQKMEADSLADMVRMTSRLGVSVSKNPWQGGRE